MKFYGPKFLHGFKSTFSNDNLKFYLKIAFIFQNIPKRENFFFSITPCGGIFAILYRTEPQSGVVAEGLSKLRTLRRIPAVPRSADFWRLLRIGAFIFFRATSVSFGIAPSAPIMIGMIFTALSSQIRFISCAKSVYFSSFSVYLVLTRTSAGIATSIIIIIIIISLADGNGIVLLRHLIA